MLFVPRRYPAPFRLCRCCSSLRQFRRLCRCRESSHMQIGIGPDQGAPHQTMGPQFAKRSRTKRSRNLQITNPVIWGRRRQARKSRRKKLDADLSTRVRKRKRRRNRYVPCVESSTLGSPVAISAGRTLPSRPSELCTTDGTVRKIAASGRIRLRTAIRLYFPSSR